MYFLKLVQNTVIKLNSFIIFNKFCELIKHVICTRLPHGKGYGTLTTMIDLYLTRASWNALFSTSPRQVYKYQVYISTKKYYFIYFHLWIIQCTTICYYFVLLYFVCYPHIAEPAETWTDTVGSPTGLVYNTYGQEAILLILPSQSNTNKNNILRLQL